MKNIAIIGTGNLACSMAYQLTLNNKNRVALFGRDAIQVDEINQNRTNTTYFPNLVFNSSVRSTANYSKLSDFNIVILAVPSSAFKSMESIFEKNIARDALVIIMAKGLMNKGETIYEFLKETHHFTNVVSLKGPSFSVELLKNAATILTLGYEDYKQAKEVNEMLEDTDINLDYTTDVNGVEYLSALKNIYAISIGHIDGKHNSLNTRYFLLTQCFNEMRNILSHLRCEQNTLHLSCGLGDLCLTALSDLSRNRTLGLLIGKGFYNPELLENSSIVLEGVKTLRLLDEKLNPKVLENLPVLNTLVSYFINQETDQLDFNLKELINEEVTTVLTYGTFDLIHYGHIEILKRAKSLGDRLIVGLSTDEFNLIKHKKCEFPFEKRKLYLESLDYVDRVIPEENWEQKAEDVKKYNVDYFVMGDDWTGEFDFLKEFCEVIYLPRTEGISTTQIKKLLKEQKQ